VDPTPAQLPQSNLGAAAIFAARCRDEPVPPARETRPGDEALNLSQRRSFTSRINLGQQQLQ